MKRPGGIGDTRDAWIEKTSIWRVNETQRESQDNHWSLIQHICKFSLNG